MASNWSLSTLVSQMIAFFTSRCFLSALNTVYFHMILLQVFSLFASLYRFSAQRTQFEVSFAVHEVHFVIFWGNSSVTIFTNQSFVVHVCDDAFSWISFLLQMDGRSISVWLEWNCWIIVWAVVFILYIFPLNLCFLESFPNLLYRLYRLFSCSPNIPRGLLRWLVDG